MDNTDKPADAVTQADRFIDRTTGRPVGDHGSANAAIEFVLHHHDDTLQTWEFLKAWEQGCLVDEWPEYYDFLDKFEQVTDFRQASIAQHEAERGEVEEVEAECARLLAAYLRKEIGRLMRQAEHWAQNDKPHAVHHRVTKADNYYQIVSLMERDPEKGWRLPFDEIREALSRKPVNPPGVYPPSAELHRYRDPEFVVAATRPEQFAESAKGSRGDAMGEDEVEAASKAVWNDLRAQMGLPPEAECPADRSDVRKPVRLAIAHLSPRIAQQAKEVARLREALRPFVDLRAQNGAWGVISKKLDGMSPLTVTVTKSQMLEAFSALNEQPGGEGK